MKPVWLCRFSSSVPLLLALGGWGGFKFIQAVSGARHRRPNGLQLTPYLVEIKRVEIFLVCKIS